MATGERAFDLGLHLAPCQEHEEPLDETSTPNLLILNQPISNFVVFAQLWSRTGYRLCADGGANRLYDMFCGELEARRDAYVGDPSFHLRTAYMLTRTRSQIQFTGTLIHYATTYDPTMLTAGLKFLRILTNVALILARLCRRLLLDISPNHPSLRGKFWCLEPWLGELIRALECCTRCTEKRPWTPACDCGCTLKRMYPSSCEIRTISSRVHYQVGALLRTWAFFPSTGRLPSVRLASSGTFNPGQHRWDTKLAPVTT